MIVIPVSLGELVDRITILEIKEKMIKDDGQLEWIQLERTALRNIYNLFETDSKVSVPELMWQKLYSINLTLWNVEEDLRRMEQEVNFGEAFVELARAVYNTNDLRSDTKRAISYLDPNESVREQKSYV